MIELKSMEKLQKIIIVPICLLLFVFIYKFSNDRLLNTNVDTEVLAVSSRPKVTIDKNVKKCNKLDNSKMRFYSQTNEDKGLFDKFFRNTCSGTFIEIGALDGITYSNTLFFEKSMNWSGVLIEGNPNLADNLMKNRPNTKNYACAVCPANEKEAMFVINDGHSAVGGLLDSMTVHHWKAYFSKTSNTVKVPCRTMADILKDAGVTQVNLFSIDVEGGEEAILKTMDWSIPVHVIVIEMGRSKERDETITKYLEQKGFKNTLPDWNIRSYCNKNGDCASNEVFVNPKFDRVQKN